MNTHIIQYLYDKSTPNSKWALQQFCHVMFSWQQSHFWHHNSVTTSSFLSVRQPECCEKWDVCSRLPPHSCSAFVQSFEKAPPSLTPSSLSPRSLCCCCCRNILSQKNEEQMLESCLQKNGRSFFFFNHSISFRITFRRKTFQSAVLFDFGWSNTLVTYIPVYCQNCWNNRTYVIIIPNINMKVLSQAVWLVLN